MQIHNTYCTYIHIYIHNYVGIHVNELADRLAKEAARSEGTNYEFNKIPKSFLYHEAAEEAIQNGKPNGPHATRWQQQNNIPQQSGTD